MPARRPPPPVRTLTGPPAELRRLGVGRALLAHVVHLAAERGCGRVEWAVLDWNAPAIAFYRSLGAEPVDGWTIHRLTGSRLEAVARSR